MREFKFRLWDEIAKRWVSRGESVEMAFSQNFPENISMKSKFYLEQYTGRKDKNGKEIYEGDIVKQLMYILDDKVCTTTWVVRWNNDKSCYDLHRISGALYGDSMLSTCPSEDCEVIGNIHESNMEELCPKE